ncbi:MAG TPA: 3-methyl-2-oxobutanoate hydroxymethyltransferase [Acidobacteriota bacterium]|nr:3-methyl-2-oxobutanoate hydroxymethyltransferase [Acidobacteriota bacterium]HNT16560.1 3-methyl-2-oxobutanoate hydroxymethyltransferase [Acidobacteriota bacterium]
MSKITVPPFKSVSVPAIRDKKRSGEKVVMVTAYDFPSAKACDQAGADLILVGDSLGMVVQGNEDTLSVTLEEMIYHTSMVARAARRALVVSDMPFLTYHTDETESVRNCGRCIKEGKAQAVKVEGGAKRASLVRTLVNNEIPVMGHIGLTPQSIHSLGGFKVQGKDEESARMLLEDALALEDAGAFSVVLECMPSEVASKITASVKIPTIGIGSGPHCDGQVLVFHDLLGISDPPHPRFVKKYKNLRDEMVEGLCQFAKEVRKGVYPSEEQSYHLQKDPRGEEKERTK